MANPLRLRFAISALAGSLLAGAPQPVRSQENAVTAAAGGKIGHIWLREPLPFTPQELIAPFGWRLSITENTEKRETIVRSAIGAHIFTFYRDDSQNITAVYSPLEKNDSDLCEALNVLKAQKPAIFQYLNRTFSAEKSCAVSTRAPG